MGDPPESYFLTHVQRLPEASEHEKRTGISKIRKIEEFYVFDAFLIVRNTFGEFLVLARSGLEVR